MPRKLFKSLSLTSLRSRSGERERIRESEIAPPLPSIPPEFAGESSTFPQVGGADERGGRESEGSWGVRSSSLAVTVADSRSEGKQKLNLNKPLPPTPTETSTTMSGLSSRQSEGAEDSITHLTTTMHDMEVADPKYDEQTDVTETASTSAEPKKLTKNQKKKQNMRRKRKLRKAAGEGAHEESNVIAESSTAAEARAARLEVATSRPMHAQNLDLGGAWAHCCEVADDLNRDESLTLDFLVDSTIDNTWCDLEDHYTDLRISLASEEPPHSYGLPPSNLIFPLVDWTNLVHLDIWGMTEKYQEYIWVAVWLMPLLQTLRLEVTFKPEVQGRIASEWEEFDEYWSPETHKEEDIFYYGTEESDGSIHESYGSGQYLDVNCLSGARDFALTRGVVANDRLPLKMIHISGMVIDNGPFAKFFDKDKFVSLLIGPNCLDAGLNISDLGFARAVMQYTPDAPSHDVIVESEWWRPVGTGYTMATEEEREQEQLQKQEKDE